MKCVYCDAELPIRAEHCYRCGKKVVTDFDTLAESVHEDAAKDRTQKIEGHMKWALLGLLVVGALIYGINDIFDRPLLYDGSGLPCMTVPTSVGMDVPDLRKAYVDPRPNPPLPEGRITAFGYRSSPFKERIRAAAKGDQPPSGLKTPRTPPAAVADGLRFLASRQDTEGFWSPHIHPVEWDQCKTKEYAWGNIGVTSLALLAFLGEGETWTMDDPTRRKSLHAVKIEKTIRFLVRSQDQATGRFRSFNPISRNFEGEAETTHFMYNQGMATLAMCEAAGMSGDEYLRAVAQKGLDLIVKAQTAKGGWNYRGDPEGENDTSLSAWQVQALYAGREAGLKVPPEAFTKALGLYKQATQAEGFVRYSLEKDDKADLTRTSLLGVALMVRQMLGEEARGPLFKKLMMALQKAQPPSKPNWGRGWRPGLANNDDGARAKFDPYMIYFATYGMYFAGGTDWDNWHEAMKKAVIEMQDSDGAWRANDTWTECGGTNYATSLIILALQVYYRIQ